MSTLRGYRVASEIVIAHIRRASFGPVELRNTHPFRREFGGRVHTFAHNGDLPGLEQRFPLESERVQKVTLIATTPLNDGDWRPMRAGELLVIRGGEIVDSTYREAPKYCHPRPRAAHLAGDLEMAVGL